ncbi:MAG: PatB family C-S lyase [Clostridia bacterium]|nr:PatB family C-S lyase [Clostridia bacterium]
MTFDFDTPVERRGTDSIKWNVGEDEIPMWVADMDFKTAPAVVRAVTQRAENGVFGYESFPENWYDAYIGWWERRHGFHMERDWLRFSTGVIPAISAAVGVLTQPGDSVALLSPVYNSFFSLIRNSGRQVSEVPMKRTRENGALSYMIDFDALDAALEEERTKVLIFCNPHNPTGKLWEKSVMEKIGLLCEKYGVTVLSDEIHCDITDPEKRVLPFAAASEINLWITATFLAPTKAFNLMGLQTAAVAAADPALRKKIFDALGDLANPNAFACTAAVAAYTEGKAWLDALNRYIRANKDRVTEFLKVECPALEAVPSEATYLMWIRTSAAAPSSDHLHRFLRKNAGLFVCPGTWYRGDGADFIRFNTGCPRSQLDEALLRLKSGLERYSPDAQVD